jgi:hypothetical protein
MRELSSDFLARIEDMISEAEDHENPEISDSLVRIYEEIQSLAEDAHRLLWIQEDT